MRYDAPFPLPPLFRHSSESVLFGDSVTFRAKANRHTSVARGESKAARPQRESQHAGSRGKREQSSRSARRTKWLAKVHWRYKFQSSTAKMHPKTLRGQTVRRLVQRMPRSVAQTTVKVRCEVEIKRMGCFLSGVEPTATQFDFFSLSGQ